MMRINNLRENEQRLFNNATDFRLLFMYIVFLFIKTIFVSLTISIFTLKYLFLVWKGRKAIHLKVSVKIITLTNL